MTCLFFFMIFLHRIFAYRPLFWCAYVPSAIVTGDGQLEDVRARFLYRLKNGLGTTRALRARLRIAMASSVPISA